MDFISLLASIPTTAPIAPSVAPSTTDWLSAIGTCVYAVATVGLAVAAFLGVVSWRRQLLGKADYDLARQILKNVFLLRDRLQAVRSPVMWASEYVNRPGRKKEGRESSVDDSAYAYRKRVNRSSDIARELELDVVEAQAIWNKELDHASKMLAKCQSDLIFAIQDYIDGKREHAARHSGRSEEEQKRIRKIMFGGSNPDEYLSELNAAVKAFEDVLRPKLKL